MNRSYPPKSSISSQTSSFSKRLQHRFPWLYALWKFSRPHTVIGTSLSALGLWAIALSQLSSAALPAALNSQTWGMLLWAWLTCLCGNVYIVGLNQLQDIEIDRVNKPHLPLASGEFSRRVGWAIVATTGSLALLLPLIQGWFLVATVWASLLLGTIYSLPPIRLKRFPFWASFCIFTVRGVIVNLGLFLHFSQPIKAGLSIPTSVWALTLFILGFTFAIAIFKDIPDLEGDRQYNISTLTIHLGQRAVFNLARWVITLCYIGIVIAGVRLASVQTSFIIVSHLIGLALFWVYSVRVDLSQKVEIAGFYQFIWKLFYLEYVIFPVACLLG
jgi:homogentisate phytyltransferase/homogentisate geranylgeranyltransferase